MAQAIGAGASPLPYGEVYTALQQGVIDGTIFDIGAILLFGFPEIAKTYTRIGYMDLPFMILMNKGLFDKYSKDVQKAILESGHEAVQYNIERLIDFDKTTDQELAKKKCSVGSVRDLPIFKERVKPLYEKYEKLDSLIPGYIKAVQSLNKQYATPK